MADAFGGSRVQARPPERGIFPLDHEGECRQAMKVYLKCLKENKEDNFPCRQFSRAYLSCRMERSLMAPDDLDSLGLGDQGDYARVDNTEKATEKYRVGFVAGSNVKAQLSSSSKP